MIDLHCHILCGMDDGAETLIDSVKMVESAVKNNIDVIIATPHYINYNKRIEFLINRNAQIDLLSEVIEKHKYKVVIGSGAEVFLNGEIFTAGDLDGLTINRSRYLLCEYTLMPFDPDRAIIYAEEIINRGYIPIIAHPERYSTFMKSPSVVNELSDMGCLFQVNAASLSGYGGEDMRRFTAELILRGFADFLATDAHSPTSRNNHILEKALDFPKEITNEQLHRMTCEMPLKVIKNEDIPQQAKRYFK